MRSIKLIALDLDGTLLDNQKELPDENKKALKYAASKGVHITVCSGRYYKGVRCIAQDVGADVAIVGGNGAEVRRMNGNMVFGKYLDLTVCRRLVDIALEYKLVFNVYAHDTIITHGKNDVTLYYERLNKRLPAEDQCGLLYTDNIMSFVESPPPGMETGILKLEYRRINSDVADELKNIISEIPDITIEGSFTKSIELHATGISKGTGLQIVAEDAGIDMEYVMAFGDYLNDIDMLNVSGFPVAMGNSDEITKAAALYVTASNIEFGVAKAIYRFI